LTRFELPGQVGLDAQEVPMANESPRPRPAQELLLVLLRMGLGWHLLYEGLVKVVRPGWTSAAFLADSRWLFSDAFHWIAAHPLALRVVDLLNAWGLVLIGLGLLTGAFARAAAVAGALLLGLYYVASPPLTGLPANGAEGSYLVVNKNLVEALALLVVAAFPVGGFFGLEHALGRLWTRRRGATPAVGTPVGVPPAAPSRRELIRSALGLPVLGGFAWAVADRRRFDSVEEKILRATGDVDAVSSATLKTFRYASLGELRGQVPHVRLGTLRVSRVIMGGNLIGGWAHARDLLYVSQLVKSYHSDQKVFETLRLAERCGINTLLTNPQLARVINAYWRREGGRIQFVSDCGYKDLLEGIPMSIDAGAHACYVHGGIADQLVRDGKVDVIGRALDLIRKNGVPAGIGGHELATVQACVEAGLEPDFWVKTLHHCDYWSARKDVQNDNIWCVNPEETIAYMSGLPQPWIAYKVLAAGAIPPREGFEYAFRNGADFICVGMYDFQIVDDVNVALDAMAGAQQRPRRWIV
jgi:uncharacterized membrane protein YphA (DoxX/SURF4 family)